MVRITNPYSFLTNEEVILRANPPRSGRDWKKSIFGPIKENIKEYLLLEQDRICPYCGLRLPKWVMFPHIEHVAHKKMHYRFMFEPKNLIITCERCNVNKGAKETLRDPAVTPYPSAGNDFLIIQPYFDNYFHHIEIVCEVILRAITDKGSKTIEYCKLDEVALMEARAEELKIDKQEIFKKMTLQLHKEDDLVIKHRIMNFLENN